MSEPLLLDFPQPDIARLRINRPEARNALNMAVRHALAEALRRLADDPEVRVIVLAGNEQAFAAGADLQELADIGSIELMQRRVHKLWQAVAECPRPIIAAVSGYALGGGCELAMHADMIVAGASARFGQPEIKVGIMPGAGGTQRLLRAVGKARAMKMLLTGCMIDAAEALAMGLISEVVDDDQVETRALELARTIAAMPPVAVEQIKEVALAGADAPLSTALMLERKAYQMLFSSADQKEGMSAFFEKRPPRYLGR